MSKTVMITGANRGLGLAFTKAYLEKDHQVLATYRKDLGGLSEIQSNPALSCYLMDVSDTQSITSAFENIKKDFSHIDSLINNAARFGNPPQDSVLEPLDTKDMLLT